MTDEAAPRRTKQELKRQRIEDGSFVTGDRLLALAAVDGLPIDPDHRYRRGRSYVPARKPDPWERQPGEPNRVYMAFKIYRDQGEERNQRKVANEMHVTHGWVNDVAVAWRWLERAGAWDQETDRVASAARLKAIASAETRHINIAQKMQQQVATRLRDHQAGTLSNKDLDRWAKEAIRIERTALGLNSGPSTQINVTTQANAQAAAKADATTVSLADMIASDPAELEAIVGGLDLLLAKVSMRNGDEPADEVPGL